MESCLPAFLCRAERGWLASGNVVVHQTRSIGRALSCETPLLLYVHHQRGHLRHSLRTCLACRSLILYTQVPRRARSTAYCSALRIRARAAARSCMAMPWPPMPIGAPRPRPAEGGAKPAGGLALELELLACCSSLAALLGALSAIDARQDRRREH